MAGDDSDNEEDPDEHYYILPEGADQAPKVEPPGFEVMPENWPAYCVFRQAGTQWRSRLDGGVRGLDYRAVQAVLEMNNIPIRRHTRLLTQIGLIERGALNKLAEIRKANGA